MLATPPIQHNRAKPTVAFIRVMPNFSNQAMPGSIKEIDELNAAIDTSTKKPVPKNAPPHISEKAIGSVSKSKPGPEPGSKPLANTNGKIAMPATKAIKVSRKATVTEALGIDWLSGI